MKVEKPEVEKTVKPAAPEKPPEVKPPAAPTAGKAPKTAASERSGTQGSTKAKIDKRPVSTAAEREEDKPGTAWIEIEVVGEDDKPISGVAFEIELPDGKIASGTTNQKGVGRLESIPEGSCKISLHKFDHDAWELA